MVKLTWPAFYFCQHILSVGWIDGLEQVTQSSLACRNVAVVGGGFSTLVTSSSFNTTNGWGRSSQDYVKGSWFWGPRGLTCLVYMNLMFSRNNCVCVCVFWSGVYPLVYLLFLIICPASKSYPQVMSCCAMNLICTQTQDLIQCKDFSGRKVKCLRIGHNVLALE